MFSHFNTNNLCSAKRQSNENIYNMPYSLFCITSVGVFKAWWFALTARKKKGRCVHLFKKQTCLLEEINKHF